MTHLYFEHAFSGSILNTEVIMLILHDAFVSIYLMTGMKEAATPTHVVK